MKINKIKTEKYLEKLNPENSEFENLYQGLKDLINTMIKYKSIAVIQLEPGDSIIQIIRSAIIENTFPIVLSEEFTDPTLYKGFPDMLHKKEYYAQFLETIVSNSIYYLATKKQSIFNQFMDELTAMAIIFQTKIISKTAEKLYGNSNKAELSDNFSMIIAYSIFRFQLQNSDSIAKVKAIDLLMNTEILKSKKLEKRFEASLAMNALIKTDKSKNLYDCLYNAGYFLEFINPRKFLKALSQAYHPMLIKGLFYTPKFKNDIDYAAFLGYKMLVISVTDILHEINQFNKFRVNLNSEFKIMKRISYKLIHDANINMKI